MAIEEIFPNPTVKQVVFQIKYPNLFYIETKISELQLRIMEVFQDSELRHRKIFSFADVGPDVDLKEIEKSLGDEVTGQKIWTFRSNKKFELNVLSSSLDITSSYHKTYNLGGGEKFRDVISFVLKNFFEVVSVPIINRLGLRYTDECPIESKDNDTFKSYYNSVLPIDRFPIDKARDMIFRVSSKRDDYNILYTENFREIKGRYVLVLDFDGFRMNVEPKECMNVTDKLHEIISMEYENTIKEPVKEYMRRAKEEEKDAAEKTG